MLDFKLEAGKLDLKREPLELRACAEDVLNLLTSKALEKNLELAAISTTIRLLIEGDMMRLRQVLDQHPRQRHQVYRQRRSHGVCHHPQP